MHQEALEEQSPLGKESGECDGRQGQVVAGRGANDDIIIGVLDIDCESLDGFDEEDEKRLQKIANLIVERSAW